jgi:2-C-methyl-D-erythritol 4-phosphate cytidylyltransferase
MKKYVLIVAGGVSSRFGSETPKQFAELKGKPVLMHTFDRFSFLNDVSFVLVLPKLLIPDWQELCKKHHFTVEHQHAEAGPKRFHSVKSGLKLVPENSIVAIHDGVRPLVSEKTIQRCFDLAEKKNSAIPLIRITESIRQVDGLFSRAVNRDEFRVVQTPQVFNSTLIKKAYRQNYHDKFTDDAVVFERDGNQVFLTEGNRENIKITEFADLEIAEKLLGLEKT